MEYRGRTGNDEGRTGVTMGEDLFGHGDDLDFLGTFTPRLDDKGRLLLPAKFRRGFTDGLVTTRGQERCLYLLPRAVFMAEVNRIRQAPRTNKQARDYMRVFMSGASDEQPDKQGRLSIPAALRAYARLDRDVAVIGTGDRVELWDLAAWETYLAELEFAYADMEAGSMPD